MEDVAMRNINPFWRTSVGFDRLLDLMDESLRFEPADHYPPETSCAPARTATAFRSRSPALRPEQVSVSVHQNTLTVSGRINEKQSETEYLYRGIAAKPFERRFSLADFVEVKCASFEDGLLQVELKREVPESMKPRNIETPMPSDKAKVFEHAKVA
jgi:molecular chaperone IbpA